MRIAPAEDRSMMEVLRENLGPAGRRGPWLKLLAQVLALAGPQAQFLRHSERPWNSVTFSGARHVIALAFTGADAVEHGELMIAALPEHEFTIPGQLVADATIAYVEFRNGPEPHMTVEAELLLLEDC